MDGVCGGNGVNRNDDVPLATDGGDGDTDESTM